MVHAGLVEKVVPAARLSTDAKVVFPKLPTTTMEHAHVQQDYSTTLCQQESVFAKLAHNTAPDATTACHAKLVKLVSISLSTTDAFAPETTSSTPDKIVSPAEEDAKSATPTLPVPSVSLLWLSKTMIVLPDAVKDFSLKVEDVSAAQPIVSGALQPTNASSVEMELSYQEDFA